MDPWHIWCDLKLRYGSAHDAEHIAAAGLTFGLHNLFVLTYAPVRVDGDLFEPLDCGLQRPRKSDWHWIIAAHFPDPTGCTVSSVQHTYDLVACSPDLLHVRARLNGREDMLGYPPAPYLAQDPVRVHATPLAWLRGGCTGVLPIGSEIGIQQWLRDCEPGIVCDSIPHAEAMLRKMKRELPALPRVMVVA